jgi:hypothetical protein
MCHSPDFRTDSIARLQFERGQADAKAGNKPAVYSEAYLRGYSEVRTGFWSPLNGKNSTNGRSDSHSEDRES